MEEHAPSLEAYLSQETFHRINVAFPGVRLLHERPYIFAVDDFATTEECLELIRQFDDENAQPSATAPVQEELRTSSSVFPSPDEVVWLRQRIAAVTDVTDAQLEPTKISRYLRGEYFRKHTDASFLNEKLWAFAARLAGVDDEGVQVRWTPRHYPDTYLAADSSKCISPNLRVARSLTVRDCTSSRRSRAAGPPASAPSFYT